MRSITILVVVGFLCSFPIFNNAQTLAAPFGNEIKVSNTGGKLAYINFVGCKGVYVCGLDISDVPSISIHNFQSSVVGDVCKLCFSYI